MSGACLCKTSHHIAAGYTMQLICSECFDYVAVWLLGCSGW